MTAKEVCDYLKLPLSTLYGLTKQGKIKGTKVGKHWRYLKSDIEAVLIGASPGSVASAERRKTERVNCELRAEIRVTLDRKDQTTHDGVIHNLSAGGIFFMPREHKALLNYAAGDPVLVSFELPASSNGTIQIHGRVTRCLSENSVGIKFKDVRDKELEALKHYVG